MKIAVCSQNLRTVTAHAGHCRRFMVFDVAEDQVSQPVMLELSIEQTLHEMAGSAPHPFDGLHILLAGSMGQCARNKLADRGILGLITDEEDPQEAVQRYLRGELPDHEAASGCTCSH
jgi:predicted Fe-Mo cluster-binding NifX family protein